jgi:hypothetical protein
MEMNTKLKKIIQQSSFEVIEGDFIYGKAATYPEGEDHFMVSKDKDEITVVTKAENERKLNLIEKNKDVYALIALNVSVPFYSVGFLAAVSKAIADRGIDILIISTYSKDYILVKKSELDSAKAALRETDLQETLGRE